MTFLMELNFKINFFRNVTIYFKKALFENYKFKSADKRTAWYKKIIKSLFNI